MKSRRKLITAFVILSLVLVYFTSIQSTSAGSGYWTVTLTEIHIDADHGHDGSGTGEYYVKVQIDGDTPIMSDEHQINPGNNYPGDEFLDTAYGEYNEYSVIINVWFYEKDWWTYDLIVSHSYTVGVEDSTGTPYTLYEVGEGCYIQFQITGGWFGGE